ncbi:MAG TPA: hypothetical protein VGX03_08770 [Candidatus Binatia bacterium]|nr:hypothetical protein [Candidatus Binatia bacterium]
MVRQPPCDTTPASTERVRLNQTTRHSYTSSLTVVPGAVRPERSAAKSKVSKPARSVLFDFAADAATLRANGCGFAQQVRRYTNLLWFDLDGAAWALSQEAARPAAGSGARAERGTDTALPAEASVTTHPL